MENQEQVWLLNEKYQGVESEAFHTDCKRLAAGEPLAYVIGSIPFLNCVIYLDNQPLIPRPETEYWTEQAIVEMQRGATKPPHVLDLCAGSGCIGVAVAKAIPNTHVDFAELDPKLRSTIEKNLATNNVVGDRYRNVTSDLFSDVRGSYDYILSNPPYIDPALDRTENSVKDYEPHQALYGGADGMEIIAGIIATAPQYLQPSGQLWLEHEPEQTKTITALAADAGFGITTHPDQYGVERFSVLQ